MYVASWVWAEGIKALVSVVGAAVVLIFFFLFIL
jgi:hypothetical protein